MDRPDHGAAHAFLVGPGGRHALGEELVIGRGEEVDLVLDSAEASRRHARLTRVDGRGYLVEDLGSKNGTYLNGELVREPSPLADGDAIHVSGATFRFLAPGIETRLGAVPALPLGEVPVSDVGGRLGIGRSPANEIVIDDPNVSRFHAEIVRVDGQVRIRDLSSRNGTYLNGQAVTDRPLPVGADVRIGPYRLIYDGGRVVTRDERAFLRLDAEAIVFEVDGKEILTETSLSLTPGELTAIIGESGSGKTTLIRLLAGATAPTGGRVSLGGESVLGRTTDVAYVPQHEIVHGRLTVEEALAYAARLRLPDDTSPKEIEARIATTVGELSLQAHRETRIGALSGGQRRRVGLAVELLARPSLLCLDEPTTGLDPMLEAQAMSLFRDLATDRRSVVLVTHATQSLGLCDRLAVMGKGGRLTFFGPPDDALDFFGAASFDDLYRRLASKPAAEWSDRFRTEREEPVAHPPIREQERDARPGRPRAAIARQTAIMASRYFRVFRRDRRNLLILFGQVPLIALALLGLFGGDVFSYAESTPGDASSLLFLLVTMAIWFGLLDSARELIKERGIFRRERAIGVRVSAYLLSKAGLLFAISALQVALLCALVFFFRPLHEDPAVYAGMFAVLFLTACVAVSMGLLTSAVVGSEDQATSFVPLLLVPQLFFAGALIPLEKMSALVADLANLVFARWSFALTGTLIDMNERIAHDPRAAKTNEYGADFFAASVPFGYAVLAGFALVFALLAGALLARRGQRL